MWLVFFFRSVIVKLGRVSFRSVMDSPGISIVRVSHCVQSCFPKACDFFSKTCLVRLV